MELHLENYDGREIVTRTGQAAPIELPKMDTITGDINTIKSFVEKRYLTSTPEGHGLQFVDKDRVVVTVDRETFAILLELDPEHPRGAVVFAKLELNPDLLKFGIDTGKMWTRDELVKFLKRQRMWFRDSAQHMTLLKAYESFTAEVQANIGKTTDFRGNVANNYNKTVKTSVPDSFVLNIPIFKGQDYKQFTVEICLESTDAVTKFWFESVELSELIIIESERIMKAQLECCKDFVIVYK